MNIVIGSAFRNSRHRLREYFARVQALKAAWPQHTIRVIAVEGDSTDDTRERLGYEAAQWNINCDVRTCNHGGPVFGSVETLTRFQALSKVGNAIFDGVLPTDDVLIYVESDLLWTPGAMDSLLEALITSDYNIVAPLIMAGDLFYDIWAYRGLDERRFSPFYPYYPGIEKGQPIEVGSVGSCLMMLGNPARDARILDDNCLVGWCKNARQWGYRIGVVPTVIVRHPA